MVNPIQHRGAGGRTPGGLETGDTEDKRTKVGVSREEIKEIFFPGVNPKKRWRRRRRRRGGRKESRVFSFLILLITPAPPLGGKSSF